MLYFENEENPKTQVLSDTSLSSTKNLIEKMQIIMNITCTRLSSIWYTIFISNNSCWKKLKIRYIVVFNMVSDKQTSDIYKSI